MELENQVCSVKLAKRLKELGVKQESHWYWIHSISADFDFEGVGKIVKDWILMHIDGIKSHRGIYSAFTVAELGEILPDGMQDNRIDYPYNKIWHSWAWNFKPSFFAKTEADARAKMLIYLLENNEIVNMEI